MDRGCRIQVHDRIVMLDRLSSFGANVSCNKDSRGRVLLGQGQDFRDGQRLIGLVTLVGQFVRERVGSNRGEQDQDQLGTLVSFDGTT
jgi:hypothetical protein